MLRILLIMSVALLASCSKSDETSGQQAGGEQGEQAVELIFNTYLPPHEPMRRNSIDDFSRRIQEESGGSIKINIPGSSLTKPDSQHKAVKDRLIDMAMISVYASRTQLHTPMLGDVPGNSLSGEAASIAMWDTYQEYFADLNEFNDVKLLSMHVMPGFNFMGRETAINTVEDFKDLKIWVSAGLPSDGVKAVGAIPVHSEFPQLFEYVSKGTVDGAMIGVGTVKQASLADHVKYMTRVPGGMGSATWAVIMNQDAWDELSAEQKAAVERAADGLPARTGRALDQRNEDALAELPDLQINNASPELMAQLQQKLAPMNRDWIEKAKTKGLENAEEAYAYYHQRMREVMGVTEEDLGPMVIDTVLDAAEEAAE